VKHHAFGRTGIRVPEVVFGAARARARVARRRKTGPLPASALTRLEALYESDFGRG
jgi:hypothetical protein